MSAQSCYPGDPWPHPYGPPHWQQPWCPSYGTAATFTWPGMPVTEDRIREIIREELAAALKALKESP